MIPHDRLDLIHRGLPALLMHCGRIYDMHTSVIIILGANADLNGAFDIHDPFLDGFIKHGPMIHTVWVIIGPSIRMGVKLNQTNRPIFFRIGPQNRKGDVMIAAQGQTAGALCEDTRDMRLQSCGKGRDIGVIKGQIPIITNVKIRQRVYIPPIGWITGLQGARFSDCARA